MGEDLTVEWDKAKGLKEGFNLFIEKWIMFRREPFGYRNSVCANTRLVSTLLTTVVLALLSVGLFWVFHGISYKLSQYSVVKYTPGIELGFKDIALATFTFIGVWGGLFWKEKASIHTKWKYLADVYNDILKQPHRHTDTLHSCRKSLRVALAVDCLKMGMWAHHSFRYIFQEELRHAIDKTNRRYLSCKGEIYEKDAESVLGGYQALLLNDEQAACSGENK